MTTMQTNEELLTVNEFSKIMRILIRRHAEGE